MTPDVVAAHNRGVASMGQFDYEQACKIFAALAESYPEWRDLQVDLAIASLNRRQAGDAERAAALLQTVQQQDPQNLRAPYCLGIVALDRGDPQAALEKFDTWPRPIRRMRTPSTTRVSAWASCRKSRRRWNTSSGRLPSIRTCGTPTTQPFSPVCDWADEKKRRRYREQFSRLENNPQARLAEMKYTRMGPRRKCPSLRP